MGNNPNVWNHQPVKYMIYIRITMDIILTNVICWEYILTYYIHVQYQLRVMLKCHNIFKKWGPHIWSGPWVAFSIRQWGMMVYMLYVHTPNGLNVLPDKLYTYIHYITLHYIALHCIALHCIALHCITLHYITLHTYMYIQLIIYIYTHVLICTWKIHHRHPKEKNDLTSGVRAIFMQIAQTTNSICMLLCNHQMRLTSYKAEVSESDIDRRCHPPCNSWHIPYHIQN